MAPILLIESITNMREYAHIHVFVYMHENLYILVYMYTYNIHICIYINIYIHIYDLLLDNSKDNYTFKSCAGQVTLVRLTNQTTRKYVIPQSPVVEGNNVSRQKEKKMTKITMNGKQLTSFTLECHQFLISPAFAKLKQCQSHPL